MLKLCTTWYWSKTSIVKAPVLTSVLNNTAASIQHLWENAPDLTTFWLEMLYSEGTKIFYRMVVQQNHYPSAYNKHD